MKYWKIKNVATKEVKISVATSNTTSPGVILKPGQFCIAEARITAPMDAQNRRGLLSINKNFDNSTSNYPLATAIDETELDKISEEVAKYRG